ncbi:MAG: aldolase/citrate lyase family protein [Intrasporangium sp.]|uniref:HpcH/HpaI aldolase family protein n=1 Tax=Intrasporangium sp. TaxID=1925024 RepID=UPI002647E915|nr:aldolase/citrate lyase family protein [Intrasporangium sp.]MDN5794805.1 aldolase/citrate lyase family protein [Intrasporangium sp.]
MTPTGLPSPTDRGRLKARLADGATTFGTFVGGASPLVAEACAAAGLDWLLLDLEHGGGGEEQLRTTIPAAAAYGVPTVVRAETTERIRAGRILDQGAAGVMFPRVDSVATAEQAVRAMRYPPAGERGVATYNRACRFGLDPGALDRADEEVLGVIQVETLGALREVDTIAALDGVDVLFVGPRDLSHALGVPGQVGAPVFLEATAAVLAAGRQHGTAVGLLVADGESAHRWAEQGWRFVAIGSDTTVLATALRRELAQATAGPS